MMFSTLLLKYCLTHRQVELLIGCLYEQAIMSPAVCHSFPAQKEISFIYRCACKLLTMHEASHSIMTFCEKSYLVP